MASLLLTLPARCGALDSPAVFSWSRRKQTHHDLGHGGRVATLC